MTSKQLAIGLGALFCLLCLAILGGVYVTNTLLQQQSDTLLNLKKQSDDLDAKQAQFLSDKQDLRKYDDLNTIAQAIVPQDKNIDIVTRQIANIARESGISSFGGISLPNSTLGGTASNGTQNATASNPNSLANNLTQLSKVTGLSGVYDLPIGIQQNVAVNYDTFLTFLTKLQQNRRTANISNVSVTPSQESNQVTFNLTIDEYIKP